MAAAGAIDLSEFEKDPRLFLFTSLTAGSSHIITATSRMETILKANKIPFQAIDTATDEKARRLWQRRARGKKLPGLVKDGFVIGDLEEIEEWNEFGELKENIGPVPANNAPPAGGVQGINIRPTEAGQSRTKSPEFDPQPSESKGPSPLLEKSNMVALPGAAEIAERNKAKSISPVSSETMGSSPPEKVQSINFAQEKMAKEHSAVEHLSAPASAVGSGTATPEAEAEVAAAATTAAEPTPPSPVQRKHRGSDVVDVPPEEIKRIESENALQEEDEDEDGTQEVTKAVEGTDLKESETTAEPEASKTS